MDASAAFSDFAASLGGSDPVAELRRGLIGEGAPVPGPFGAHALIYADYVASGRALTQVESFVMERVLPYYANSHTEASFCGEYVSRLRAQARAEIARLCGAGPGFSTIFSGSGATAGLNRLVGLCLGDLGEAERGRCVVLVGPYEHHSNILPWRESGAQVVEIAEAADGGPHLAHLRAMLTLHADSPRRIGAFSIASNVTGVVSDADAVTALLKRHGALAIWDYAGGGPYLPIDMKAGTAFEKDAVVVSPHKFPGGPGASGVLIVRDGATARRTPTLPGGGTVRFVSPWGHDYAECLVAREEAGTPNIVGDIRAALCFLVKAAIGQDRLDARHAELRSRACEIWARNPNIEILGNPDAAIALPIFSLRIRDRREGGHLHQQLFTRMLSDLYGIQARGGCACAGPYAHRLIGIDRPTSGLLRQAILDGDESRKPGWTRLNLSALLDDAKADRIIEAVDTLARDPYPIADRYGCDRNSARFRVPA